MQVPSYLWPQSGLPMGAPLSPYHSRTVLSSDLDTTSFPSALHTEWVSKGYSAFTIPPSYLVVVRSWNYKLSVGAHRSTSHHKIISTEWVANGCLAFIIQPSNCLVVRHRNDNISVDTYRNACKFMFMSTEWVANGCPALTIPSKHCLEGPWHNSISLSAHLNTIVAVRNITKQGWVLIHKPRFNVLTVDIINNSSRSVHTQIIYRRSLIAFENCFPFLQLVSRYDVSSHG